MVCDTDGTIKEIEPTAREVILQSIVERLFVRRHPVVTGEAFGFHEMRELVDFLAVRTAPPGFRGLRRKPVEEVIPFTQLDSVKDASMLQGFQSGCMVMARVYSGPL